MQRQQLSYFSWVLSAHSTLMFSIVGLLNHQNGLSRLSPDVVLNDIMYAVYDWWLVIVSEYLPRHQPDRLITEAMSILVVSVYSSLRYPKLAQGSEMGQRYCI